MSARGTTSEDRGLGMAVKGVRAAGVAAAAGAITVLAGAATMVAQPSGYAVPADVADAAAAAPPGNNGTIKIDGVDADSGPPDSNPHQGCRFTVQFYNYEQGPYNAVVLFEDRPPTADGGLQVVSGDLTPFIGEDPAGGGNDLDAQVVYTLSFTGQQHPVQGYHVRITITAPGSIGNDTKRKVFWVKGCDTPPTTPPTTPPETPPTTPPETPPTTPPETPPTTPPETPPTTPPETPPTTPPETPPTTPPETPSTSRTPPVTSPTSGGTQSSEPTRAPSSPVTSGVPTAVDAGLSGPPLSPTVATDTNRTEVGGALMTIGGMLLAGSAIATLRRQGRHTN